MTSKFFAAGNASSDSQESEQEVKVTKNFRKTRNIQRDLKSSDSEDDKRKVVGEKEKKWSLIKKLCQKIKDKLKINDFSEVNATYQELMKEIDRSKNLIEKDGYPSFYMKLIIQLIDHTNTFEGKSKLNVVNGKEFTKLKQKMKKVEKDFEEELEKFKNKKEESEKEEEKETEKPKKIKKPSFDAPDGDPEDDGDDDDEEEEKSKVSEIESDSEEDDKSPLDSTDPMIRRKYWMKKKPQKGVKEKEKEKKEKKVEEDKEKQKQKEKLQQKKIDADTKGKKFKLAETKERATTFTSDQAKKVLYNALKQKGKIVDEESRGWILSDINNILDTLTTDSEILSSLFVEVQFILDTSKSQTKTHFKKSDWELAYQKVNRIYKIISKSKDDNLLASLESFQAEASQPQNVLRDLINFMNTLHQELKKALVFTEVSELEYYERLQDLLNFIELNYNLLKLYEERCDIKENITLLASSLIENTYYLTAENFEKLKHKYQSTRPQAPSFIELRNPETFARVAKLALLDNQKETKAKNLLYIVYNHAIYERQEGRNLLLTSSLIDSIHSHSFNVQTLFNRALVQLGLNSFIEGNLYEVQNALSDICSTTRVKELLAQGFLKQQQQALQHRKLPYYLHINVDVIESAELIASMLIQMPYFFKSGGRFTSKTFKRIYDQYEKSHFVAEPLSSKDIIYSASKELQKSNWKECYEKLLELDFWKYLRNSSTAKANILKRIKEQALKCYLLANQVSFSTLQIASLQQKFQIQSPQQVHSIINRLIFYGDLNAAATLDGHIKFYHMEVNKMDKIIQELCEKASELVSTNESNLKTRLGTRVGNQDEDQARENPLEQRKNNRRGNRSERNKLLGVKKVVVAQRKAAQ